MPPSFQVVYEIIFVLVLTYYQRFIEQGLQLSLKPHIVIAAPGSLRHHHQIAQPPIRGISPGLTQFIVLDEADRQEKRDGFTTP